MERKENKPAKKFYIELFLSQAMNFQFVYPSERDIIPEFILNALIEKIKEQ